MPPYFTIAESTVAGRGAHASLARLPAAVLISLASLGCPTDTGPADDTGTDTAADSATGWDDPCPGGTCECPEGEQCAWTLDDLPPRQECGESLSFRSGDYGSFVAHEDGKLYRMLPGATSLAAEQGEVMLDGETVGEISWSYSPVADERTMGMWVESGERVLLNLPDAAILLSISDGYGVPMPGNFDEDDQPDLALDLRLVPPEVSSPADWLVFSGAGGADREYDDYDGSIDNGITGGGWPGVVPVGDITGDGLTDFVGSTADGGNHPVLLEGPVLGDVKLGDDHVLSTRWSMWPQDSIDWNGDGQLDLVGKSYDENGVADGWLIAEGGDATRGERDPMLSVSEGVAFGPAGVLHFDGRPSLLAVAYGGDDAGEKQYLLPGGMSGHLALLGGGLPSLAVSSRETWGPAPFDLDGDGVDELWGRVLVGDPQCDTAGGGWFQWNPFQE